MEIAEADSGAPAPLILDAPEGIIGIVSDVHSNIHALEAVLGALDDMGAAAVYCLGDVVGYNAFPEECARLVRDCCAAAVMGNHDWASTVGDPGGFNPMGVAGVRHTRESLTSDTRAWLGALPLEARVTAGDVTLSLYHAAPHDPLHTYITPADAPRLLAHEAPKRRRKGGHVIALGHTHVPMAFVDDGTGAPRAAGDRDAVRIGGADAVTLVNPGSVGQPRDGDPRAAFATLDAARRELRLHRVPYDVEAAVAAVRDAGLPGGIGDRLLIGR